MTRACWQGLPWIRYVCEREWGTEYNRVTNAVMRGGHIANEYFERLYQNLPNRVVKTVHYYRQFWEGSPLSYVVCANGIKTVYEGVETSWLKHSYSLVS